jgi:hypothetical protein
MYLGHELKTDFPCLNTAMDDPFRANHRMQTRVKGMEMKKISVVAALCLTFVAGAAFAEKVHDWHDLDEVHKHVEESINEMQRARQANHYDMAGHGARAEEDLRAAEHELRMAIDASKAAR